ncbi:hypothetical protein [Nocardioides acrostichi]|uniref:Uncharacterized protein n=1 Tax=Nocardioides acrostichi TaxID=2784339 RepID=A0A930UWJ1_9ACTN|nr:hypothetical protein [Nocardioides acrostichi]MBF4162163.1 hypothetical protein [Nocardioides acrostichi]
MQPVIELVVCPDCDASAEVVRREVWPSTDGPVEHAVVSCVARHLFTLPASALVSATAAAAGGPAAPR